MTQIYKNWRDYPMEDWRWENFSPQEIACRGTGRLLINPRAMDMLQRLRSRLGRPMIVNSGYRSPAHNTAVGGAPNSKHLKGIAFDVRMDNHDPHHYIAQAIDLGFKGIGTYPRQGFVHVDARRSTGRWGAAFPHRNHTPDFPPEEPMVAAGHDR